MATGIPGFGVDGRLADGNGDTAANSSQALHPRTPRWTAAHTEAARFVGECIGAGALLGMVASMGRPRRGD